MGKVIVVLLFLFSMTGISFSSEEDSSEGSALKQAEQDSRVYLKDRIRNESLRSRLKSDILDQDKTAKVVEAVPETERILPPPTDIEDLQNELQQLKSDAAALKEAIELRRSEIQEPVL